MKKIGLLVFSLTAVTGVTSCGVFSRHVWSWENSTKNDTINYCLLIGQEDHNDSMYRTRGTRMMLNTRPKGSDGEYDEKHNFNLEQPVDGEITLKGRKYPQHGEKVVHEKTFAVKEIEHAEMKSLAGTTWDPITANETTANWTAKHGGSTTMFISNNDGMAEGAIGACGWYQGMPMFGYDANVSTLRYIVHDKIMGTIDSNTPSQCLAASILIRNIFEHNQECKKDPAKANEYYNPCIKGFRTFYPTTAEYEEEKPYKTDYGWLTSNVSFDGCGDFDNPNKDVDNPNAHHAVLVKNNAVTKFKDVCEGTADTYFDDGEHLDVFDGYFKDGDPTKLLSPQERVTKFEGNAHNPDHPDEHNKIQVLQTYYSATDVFFTENMQKYFDIFQPMFGLEIKPVMGDGVSELDLLNKFEGAVAGKDAYLLNVVKPTDASKFIDKIAKALGAEPKTEWKDRNPTPIIFWNRQPTNLEGEVSTDVMNDNRFKYIYYIGFDAKQGGELQGKMEAAYLNNLYVEHNEN